MRIEDVDHTRCRPAYEQAILEDLRWLGLDWDEGPDVGGPHGPYRQSERGRLYQEAANQLELFSCSCTRKELSKISGSVYPGTCRNKNYDPIHGKAQPEKGDQEVAWRWMAPKSEIAFVDALAGKLTQNIANEVGDFVLRRKDGAWAYQLAVVVDDHLMGVSDVLRGADLFDNTPRQIALQHALGYSTPRYLHVPLVLGINGKKLSKSSKSSDRPPTLFELRQQKVDPETIVAALARSLGLVDERVSKLSPTELLEAIDSNWILRMGRYSKNESIEFSF